MLRPIRTTHTFLDEVAEAKIDYPGSQEVIYEFLDNRRKNQVWEGYGAKDSRLKGPLSDTWHVHIVHGQLRLLYGISADYLDAYCLRSHDYFENTSRQRALRKTIGSFRNGSFLPYGPLSHAVHPTLKMSPSERQVLDDNIYALVADHSDRKVVEDAARGNFEDLRAMMCILSEQEPEPIGFWDAILEEYGGHSGLRSFLTGAIRSTTRLPTQSGQPKNRQLRRVRRQKGSFWRGGRSGWRCAASPSSCKTCAR